IAMPLVMALVVLPTASRWVSATAASPSTSPDISAMPWALSVTGPKESMDTMTPTVVRRPVPASATANRASVALPVPTRQAAPAEQQGGVDPGLQAGRHAGQDDGRGAGERAFADLPDRLAVGLGEVPGEQLDGAGQHQADDHRADREPLRIAAVGQDATVGD